MSKWWMVKCALAALVFAPLLGACDGTDEQVAGAAPLPETAAATLAQKLVAAQDLETAVGITREVLARGGIATRDGDAVLVDAIGPAAPFQATPLETLHLAMQARKRPGAGTLTVAEFAQMLEGFGWPFRDADPDGDADQFAVGDLPEEYEQLARQQRTTLEDRASNAEVASEAAVEAERLAASERSQALVERIREATLAWQKARQAWARAAQADKPAAQQRVAEALAARKALIEQRGVASREAGQALQALRERNRSDRETAARLEQVAARIGPDHAAGEQLMELFATWVREAARDPHDPRNFTPLFLAEMARLQDPPVDLAGSRFQRPGRGPGAPVDLRGPPRSAQMRLTLLEMQLIAAAFHRGSPGVANAGNDGPGYPVAAIANWLVPTARADASTPCSDFKKALRDTAGAPAGEGATVLASEALGKALGKAVEVATDKAGSEAFGEMMGSLGIAARIIKLVSFYADTQVSVHAAPDPVHKPPTGGLGIAFTATAGVSEQELEEYERLNGDRASQVQRDCYATLGLPTMPNIAELAKEAENWLVEWKIVEGRPIHVDYGPLSINKVKHGQYGVWGMQLRRSSPHAASARLIVVQTSDERTHTGTQVRTYAVTKGSVNAAGTPSLGTWVNAVKGGLGLADALVELAAGWTQSMVKPKAYASVEIQYHCREPTTLHDGGGNVGVADGGSGDGIPDSCLLPGRKID